MTHLIIMSLSLLSLLSCSFCFKPRHEMTSYRYSSGNGYALWYKSFSAELTGDGRCLLTIESRNDFANDGRKDSLYVDKDVMQHIEEIYRSHKIYRYRKEYNPIGEVMDGTSWSYSAYFGRETNYKSNGYQRWPKDNGLNVINSYIASFFSDSLNTDKL